jgi:hypothetical protein
MPSLTSSDFLESKAVEVVAGILWDGREPIVYVVATSKGNMTVYWAAATKQAEAVATVQQRIPPGWTAILSDRRLTPDQVASLRLRLAGVRQLKFGGVFGGKEVSQHRT